MDIVKIFILMALAVLLPRAQAETTVMSEFVMNRDREISVASGNVTHINRITGTKAAQLTKTGEGALEVDTNENASVSFAIVNGSFEFTEQQLSSNITLQVNVADGASARYPFAGLTVTNLIVASGTLEAKPLIVPTNGCIRVNSRSGTIPCLKTGKLVIGDPGVLVIDGVEESVSIGAHKLIDTTDCEGSVSNWIGKSSIRKRSAKLEKRDDGIYLIVAPMKSVFTLW